MLSTGCVHHLAIQAPVATAPVAERRAAYDALRPTRIAETHVTYFDRWFARHQRYVDYLELANGTRVALADDLLPLVPEDSEAAGFARQSRDLRVRRRAFSFAGLGGILGGVAVMIGGLAANSLGGRRALLIGGGVMIGSGIGFRFGSRAAHSREQDAKSKAFVAFDDALRLRLDVCGPGDHRQVCAPTEWEDW